MSTRIVIPAYAALAKEKLGVVLADDGRLWRWDGSSNVYRPDGLREAEHLMAEDLGHELRASHIHELRTILLSGRFGMELAAANPPGYINLRNGVYEMETRTLLAPSPHLFFTGQVPHDYKPGATSPRFDAALARTFEDPAEQMFVWDWFGYTVGIPDNRYKRALAIYGRGDSGKSLILYALQQLLGAENVSAQSLQAISDQKFALASLVGKMANIADDLSNRGVLDTGPLKKIVGGLALEYERKGKDPIPHRFGTKLIFSTNEMPGTGDASGAYYQRWHLLAANNVIPPEEQDPSIFGAVTSPEEMEGVLLQAIAGAHRLLDRGGFDVPASVTASVKEYREDTDSVYAWIDQECEVGEVNAFTSRKDAYTAFTRFAEGENRAVMIAPRLYKRIRAMGVEDVDRGSGNRGFRLRLSQRPVAGATTSTAPLF